jgi:hypothetical protein
MVLLKMLHKVAVEKRQGNMYGHIKMTVEFKVEEKALPRPDQVAESLSRF